MKRREFIKKSALTAASFTIVPSFVLGRHHIPPSDTLYMAGIGIGGRGSGVAKELHKTGKVKFTALCDVDANYAADSFKKFPKAKRYADYRECYDKELQSIDAFFVATPDHSHACIALPFMRAKKHAYVEKPLTHTIYEARLMAETAIKMGIITQMGNQGASSQGLRMTQQILAQQLIGKINRVDCWTNRPVWPQGTNPISGNDDIPPQLDWDLWLGPAKYRPYNKAYLPFRWRGFWDFGTGALGDMGCHIMETPYNVLGLGHPKTAEASCTTMWSGDFVEADYPGLCPPSSLIRLVFDHKSYGEVELNWYDGGIMPKIPELIAGKDQPGDSGGGSLFYGEKGLLITNTYSGNPRIYYHDGTYFEPKLNTIEAIDHADNFVTACLNNSPTTTSPFSYAGPLTETVLMGNLALRAYQQKVLKKGKKQGDWDPYNYPGRKVLHWDAEKMKVTNYPEAEQWVSDTYRMGFEL